VCRGVLKVLRFLILELKTYFQKYLIIYILNYILIKFYKTPARLIEIMDAKLKKIIKHNLYFIKFVMTS
jgi:hypothetical protein